MLLSGAWGKVIHEKNLKQKISRQCPFKFIELVLCWAWHLTQGQYRMVPDLNVICVDFSSIILFFDLFINQEYMLTKVNRKVP